MPNPWLEIDYSDYVKHMSSSDVKQYQLIRDIFKESLIEHEPMTIFVPGCTIGNGFEFIDWDIVHKVVALDINGKYLTHLKQKYGLFESLKIIEDDLLNYNSINEKYDLIFAALLFEYLNVEAAVNKLREMMHGKTILVSILQAPSSNMTKISKTVYTSLEKLDPIMNLIDIEEFKKMISALGMKITEFNTLRLESGKVFYVSKIQLK